jgi:hypothetical protein
MPSDVVTLGVAIVVACLAVMVRVGREISWRVVADHSPRTGGSEG